MKPLTFTTISLGILFILASSLVAPSMPQDAPRSDSILRKSGMVHLEITCRPEVKEDFRTAVALLHSFFYDEARRRFEEIAQRDPQCAMAWWGVAMTWYHPLWAPPTPEELSSGIAAVDKAKAIGGKTELERGLIDAIGAFFRSEEKPPEKPDLVTPTCHGPRSHGARAEAFRESLERLHQKRPDDLEVSVFYTLALLGTAPPTDKSYTNQLKATAILEPLSERYPNHPGIAHYIIHAYDYPSLATRGLPAARKYSDIAPWVPHALHMPSHIYTRLGMWEESIKSNLAASSAARDYSAQYYQGITLSEDLHALDYLTFAYLQTGQDRKAGEVLDHVLGINRIQPINEFAIAYAVGAIPARYALERRRWKDAATLKVPHPKLLNSYPYALAHIEFAHALGAAHSGDVEAARQAVSRLKQLRDSMTDPKFQWWANQVEIQRLASAGWLAHAERKDEEALRLLREATELEDRSGLHPVTPGQILPAREQLGDLLLKLNRPSEALVEYEKSLESFPNRLNSHYGAARSAELSGKTGVARQHYERIIEMAGHGDGLREELVQARDFLAKR
jgi:tetratricopeptide (TPR) repeat protein